MVGLFAGTRMLVASVRGGTYGHGTPREPLSTTRNATCGLRAILAIVGLDDVIFAHAEMRAAIDGE